MKTIILLTVLLLAVAGYPGDYPQDCDTEPVLLWDAGCYLGSHYGHYSCEDYDLGGPAFQYQTFNMVDGSCRLPQAYPIEQPPADLPPLDQVQYPLFVPLSVSGPVTVMCAPGVTCPWPPTSPTVSTPTPAPTMCPGWPGCEPTPTPVVIIIGP